MRVPKGRFERVIIKGVMWVGIIFLLMGMVFLAGSVWEVYQKEQEARLKLDHAVSEQVDLRQRKALLEENLAALENERGLEAEFRERFSVARDGEEIIVLFDENNSPDDTIPLEEGLWGRLRGWFNW